MKGRISPYCIIMWPCNIKIITELFQSGRYELRKAWTNIVLSIVFCKYMLTVCLEKFILPYSGRRPASPGKQSRIVYHFKCPTLEENKQPRVMTTGLESTWHSGNYKIKSVILANGILDTCYSTRWCLFQQEGYYNISLGLSFSSYKDIMSDTTKIN